MPHSTDRPDPARPPAAGSRSDVGVARQPAETAVQPADLQGLAVAGAAAYGQARYDEAITRFARMTELAPGEMAGHLNLGHALMAAQRFDEALASYRNAAALRADRADAQYGIGNALNALGRLSEAVPFFGKAAALMPDNADVLCHHGNALLSDRQYGAAAEAYRRAIAARPGDAGLMNNLASALRYSRSLEEAEAAYRDAIAADPDYADAYGNLGVLLRDMGRLSEGIAQLREALRINPAANATHSNLIFCLDFLPDIDVAAHQAERRSWHLRHEVPRRHLRPALQNRPEPERVLRVGYVSADFKVHSASALFGPVILNHDRSRFDVTCYSSTVGEDFRTAQFAAATRFRRVNHLDDTALAAQIQADGIDILVDLSGHTAGNRLLTFAQKPAPVQVTAWGHATSTGLEAMDYFFADPYLVPAAERHLYAEQIADLPCLLCFEAPHYAPDVAALPADTNGCITFGCLNRLAKVSPEVLTVWAEILRGTPGSRLLLKGNGMAKAANQARFRSVMESAGVSGERLIFRDETPHIRHLATYGEVDIALDPFPYCGGTTTCEALWMGVPVVAMAGRVPASRLGVAILSALGFPGLVAADRDGYVALACGLAANTDLLRRLRAELRPRFAAAPVGNVPLYTRAVEDSYRAMWRRWCQEASRH
ncbi:tetratricopeptide repeat protein [Marinibaculum pumilum]|uniref:protein O-GlcNAc transferase n=1 Tax=Marinibaculum pumilum TaxID=1766165 RepID=A0ABV7KYF1_9PROT